MTKHRTTWTLIAMALAVTATSAFACDGHAPAAETKEPTGTATAAPVAALAAPGDAKGCDMPCCAHAKEAADVKAAAPVKAEAPCAAHEAKGCPKKPSGALAKAASAQDVPQAPPVPESPKAAPATDPGTQR